MKVHEAMQIAREWVAGEGSATPGFCGAHLMGSILAANPDAEFPSWGDVDFNLVVERDQPTETHNVSCHGLILEYSVVSRAPYNTAEALLANPELAWNLAQPGVLMDRDGSLTVLQHAVAQHYGERRWVIARCAAEKAILAQFFAMLDNAHEPAEAAWGVSGSLMFLSGLLAVSHGAAPTHRRCMVLLRELLAADGHPELYREALELLGYAHTSQAQVALYLDHCAEAFDRAVQVRRSPHMFAFKFQPHARPYIIEGARELIAEGNHREAMYWIEGWLTFSNMVLRADAPTDELPPYGAVLAGLLHDKGADRADYVSECQVNGHRLADQICAVADGVAAATPE